MKERPILFSGPMVRALLARKKTQTRRVVKHIPALGGPDEWCSRAGSHEFSSMAGDYRNFCPYGAPVDRLWVKETFWTDRRDPQDVVIYAATPEQHKYRLRGFVETESQITTDYLEKHQFWNRRPSIFMWRWASRLTLKITAVRVERLNDISAVDALAEGVSSTEFWTPNELNGRPFEEKWWDDFHFWSNYPQLVYRRLWESINGAGSWAKNPWVWVNEFQLLEQSAPSVPATP